MACPNCGADVDDVDGPTHPYMVASPGCWAGFGALQAAELGALGYPPAHGLAVDAYAASHPGDGSERRDRQSVAIHLAALHAVLERGFTPAMRIALLRRLTDVKRDWPRFERPDGVPGLTWQHVDVRDHERTVREWAGAVWAWWSPVHAAVAATVD